MDDEEEPTEVPDMKQFHIAEDLEPYLKFQVRPDIENRFKNAYAQEVIRQTLYFYLSGKNYGDEDTDELTKLIANSIRNKLEGEIYSRYKLLVHVVLGEHKGAGVKVAARCLWDPDCDTYVSDSYISETIFCVATVFGILFY